MTQGAHLLVAVAWLGGPLNHVGAYVQRQVSAINVSGYPLMVKLLCRSRRVAGQGQGQVSDSVEDGPGVGRSHRGLGAELRAPGVRVFLGRSLLGG